MPEVQLYALAFLVSAVTAGASITTEGRCNFNVQAHSHTVKSRVVRWCTDNATVRKITARQHDFAVAEISVPLIGNGNRKPLILLLHHKNVSLSAIYIIVFILVRVSSHFDNHHVLRFMKHYFHHNMRLLRAPSTIERLRKGQSWRRKN